MKLLTFILLFPVLLSAQFNDVLLFGAKKNMVQNGMFSASTGWTLSGGANATISGGVLYLKRDGTTGIADNALLAPIVAGRQYRLSIRTIVNAGNQNLSIRDGSSNTLVIVPLSPITYSATFTAVANSVSLRLVHSNSGGEGYYDNLILTPAK